MLPFFGVYATVYVPLALSVMEKGSEGKEETEKVSPPVVLLLPVAVFAKMVKATWSAGTLVSKPGPKAIEFAVDVGNSKPGTKEKKVIIAFVELQYILVPFPIRYAHV